jgi:hypothetical protein
VSAAEISLEAEAMVIKVLVRGWASSINLIETTLGPQYLHFSC